MTATLRKRPTTQRVLRHLMERQQAVEIGARIRELRENSAETNRSIADYCDVGERSVAGWVAGDGIAYKNAKKVAVLFEVDLDWLWRGRETKPDTPDLMDQLSAPASSADLAALRDQLDRIEQQLGLLLGAQGLDSDARQSEQESQPKLGSSGTASSS